LCSQHKLLADIDVYISLKTHKNSIRAEARGKGRVVTLSIYHGQGCWRGRKREKTAKGFTRISFANFMLQFEMSYRRIQGEGNSF
jgi:hypothetical protein